MEKHVLVEALKELNFAQRGLNNIYNLLTEAKRTQQFKDAFCYTCQQKGHFYRNCPTCYVCHQKGHVATNCTAKNTAGCWICQDISHYAAKCPNKPEPKPLMGKDLPMEPKMETDMEPKLVTDTEPKMEPDMGAEMEPEKSAKPEPETEPRKSKRRKITMA